jgi:hypothetical protein
VEDAPWGTCGVIDLRELPAFFLGFLQPSFYLVSN